MRCRRCWGRRCSLLGYYRPGAPSAPSLLTDIGYSLVYPGFRSGLVSPALGLIARNARACAQWGFTAGCRSREPRLSSGLVTLSKRLVSAWASRTFHLERDCGPAGARFTSSDCGPGRGACGSATRGLPETWRGCSGVAVSGQQIIHVALARCGIEYPGQGEHPGNA